MLDVVDIQSMSDSKILDFMQENGISLKVNEAREVVKLLDRNPTLTELHIFNIQWSEHCSYKSSRDLLKLFPTSGPTVIMGPGEDSGILRLCDGYGLVISHESHNHPSQVVPYEGAATGVGGIYRDVLCMGSRVIATADPLRFGSPTSSNKNRTKYIANAVIDGIAGYGNALGVPNIAGDVYMNTSFDDNCLVNVVCMGIIKDDEIIHSYAPEGAAGFDIIAIGKATDNSGFGGAAFASLVLDSEDTNKGAVQVPDPFLKNVIDRATHEVFKAIREGDIPVGFKDCGAGGIMCATSELCEAGGVGAVIDVEKIHTSMEMPPYMTACSETQERFCWIVPKEFTPTVLKIYNDDFDLPNVCGGAMASVIGEVTADKQYVLKYKGNVICDAHVEVVTKGIKYDRESREPTLALEDVSLPEPNDYNVALLNVLSLPQIACKKKAYEHYDTVVQGNTVIGPGYADAGVVAPIPGNKAGVALSVDGNPRYNCIDPFRGAAHAVCEAMRNVACVGATPIGLTDCLNYGNPEVPEQFWTFKRGVEGLSDAATHMHVKGTTDPCPFVSGNVSFYNESKKGESINPSPIVSCVGRLKDYSKAITTRIKKEGSVLCLVGPRKDELGGSAYYDSRDKLGSSVPELDYAFERAMMYGVIDAITHGHVLSCHDISDGGVIVTVAEMILGVGDGAIGAEILLNDEMKTDSLLFSETPGFVMEVMKSDIFHVEKIFEKYGVDVFEIGKTGGNSLKVTHGENDVIDLPIEKMADAWTNGFVEAIE